VTPEASRDTEQRPGKAGVAQEEVRVMATRHDPFGDTARLMDQLFGTLREPGTATVPALPMDLYRDGDHYVMHVDLPGADPGSIDVNVEDRTLTIRAERTGRTESDVQWLARERPTGTYVRQLTVGRGLALDAIDAGYADGVLTLTIPVAEEAKPRRVEIKHAGNRTALGSAERREESTSA
jgi:HSP20 family protein